MQCLLLLFLHPSTFLKNLNVNSIWYHPEALEVFRSPNLFLNLDFFAVSYSTQALVSYSCSFRTNLVSFRTFRLPLFPKPVSCLGLFFDASYNKRALVLCFCIRVAMFLFDKRQNTKRIYFVACRSALSQITRTETN